MAKGQSLQDPFLNILRKEKVPVSIYWSTASNCKGRSTHLTSSWYCSRTAWNQMVYKHAISTIVPARNIRLPLPDSETGDSDD